MQPITITDISSYAKNVLGLEGKLAKLFFRYMEEVDNAVLSDYYSKSGK